MVRILPTRCRSKEKSLAPASITITGYPRARLLEGVYPVEIMWSHLARRANASAGEIHPHAQRGGCG
jgi:hypothetical protein